MYRTVLCGCRAQTTDRSKAPLDQLVDHRRPMTEGVQLTEPPRAQSNWQALITEFTAAVEPTVPKVLITKL
jgi:hypothetical protein